MGLDRIKKLIKEAVFPLDYRNKKQDRTMEMLLYNIASHKNPEEGFRSLADVRTQLSIAIVNDYIVKNPDGKYFLTKKGQSKLRQLYGGEHELG